MKQVASKIEFTEPVFLKTSEEIRTEIAKYSMDELAKKMKIKGKTLEKTYAYYHEDFPLTSAIDAYSGTAFKQVKNFNEQYLKSNVIILSALYGALKPSDGIKPYRLDFTMAKIIDKPLYQKWQEPVSELIDQINPQYILNLASEEYTKVIRNKISKDTEIIDLNFNEKVNSTSLKKYRGQILDYCILHEIVDYEDLENVEFSEFIIQNLTSGKINIKVK